MDIIEQVIELYINQKLSKQQTADRLGLSKKEVVKIIADNNIKKIKPKQFLKDFLKIHPIEEIFNYFANHSREETAIYFGITLRNLKTLLHKYDIKHTEEQKYQFRTKTCQEMYGVACVFQRADVREKCDSPEASKKMMETQIKNNLEKYGVKYSWERPEVQAKIKETNFKKYGGVNWTQTEEGRQKISKIQQNKELQDKINKTKKLNHSFNSSKIEEEYKIKLIEKFGIDDIICQYRDARYQFNCDFYIKSLDLFIEINNHWTHGFHPFDKNNIEDIEKLNKWIEKSKTSKFYKIAINTWTIRDTRKLEIAKNNNLKYIMVYPKETIMFNID